MIETFGHVTPPLWFINHPHVFCFYIKKPCKDWFERFNGNNGEATGSIMVYITDVYEFAILPFVFRCSFQCLHMSYMRAQLV